MTAYWIAYLVPLTALFSPLRATLQLRNLIWLLMGIYLTLFIGLRHEVGMDWVNYLIQFESRGVAWSEPGYAILNMVTNALGFDIHFVNLVCAFFFVLGLVSFCKREPIPWLALATTLPYLVIVVAMGYTKQAAALGLFLWGLVRLRRGELKTYVFVILVATSLHASALICLLFAAITAHKRALRATLVVSVLFVTVTLVFLASRFDALIQRFAGSSDLESHGAAIRMAMNVGTFAVLLLFRKKWRERYGPLGLLAWMGWLSVAGLALVPFASTAVDRVALYFAPLQIMVWSRLPTLFDGIVLRTQLVMVVVLGYGAVLAAWFNFGIVSWAWLPYQNVLVDWLLP